MTPVACEADLVLEEIILGKKDESRKSESTDLKKLTLKSR